MTGARLRLMADIGSVFLRAGKVEKAVAYEENAQELYAGYSSTNFWSSPRGPKKSTYPRTLA